MGGLSGTNVGTLWDGALAEDGMHSFWEGTGKLVTAAIRRTERNCLTVDRASCRNPSACLSTGLLSIVDCAPIRRSSPRALSPRVATGVLAGR